MHTDCLTECKTIVSCLLLKFIQKKLQLTFDDTQVTMQVWKSSTYNKQSMTGFKHSVMMVIFIENKATDRMLLWCIPLSCGWGSENVDPSTL